MKRLHAFTFFLLASLIAAAPAAAQVTSIGVTAVGPSSGLYTNGAGLNTAVAYDDKHDVYLVVWNQDNGVLARFIRFDGTPAGANFFIGANASGHNDRLNIRAAYSRGTSDDVFFVLFTEHFSGPPTQDLGRAVVRRFRYTGTGSSGGVPLDNGSIPVTTAGRMANDLVFNPITRRFVVVTEWTEIEASQWTPGGLQVGGYVNVSGTNGSLSSGYSARLAHDWQSNRYTVRYVQPVDRGPGFQPGFLDIAQLLDGESLQPQTPWLSVSSPFGGAETTSFLPETGKFLVTLRAADVYAATGPPASTADPAIDLPGFDRDVSHAYDPVSRRVFMAGVTTTFSNGTGGELAAALFDGTGARIGSAFLVPGARTGLRAVSVLASRNGEFAVTYSANGNACLERFAITPAPTPGPRFSNVLASIDGPANAATVSGPFLVGGWALDFGAMSVEGSGIDAVHAWAFPSSGGSAIFLGEDRTFHARSDIAGVYGAQFGNAGYDVNAPRLPDGTYTIVVYPHSTVAGGFIFGKAVSVTVANVSNPVMALDGPGDNVTISQPFLAGGWAIDRGASLGTGIDAVHVWAFPVVNGTIGAGQFVAQGTTAGSRPDVGAVYGSQFTSSGYTFTISTLAPGTYILGVYARSTVSGTFNQVKFVTITVQ